MIKTIIKVGITMLFLATTLFAQTTGTNPIVFTPPKVSNGYVSNFGTHDFTLTKDGVALLVCKSIPDTKLGDGAVKDCAISEHSNTDEVIHGILKCFLDQLEKAQHATEIQYNERELLRSLDDQIIEVYRALGENQQKVIQIQKKELAKRDEEIKHLKKIFDNSSVYLFCYPDCRLMSSPAYCCNKQPQWNGEWLHGSTNPEKP